MGIRESIEGKKKWRKLQKRAEALPKEYVVVYKEIQKYFLKVAPIQVTTTLEPLEELLDIFEEGAARDNDVLSITGADVASFADSLLGELPPDESEEIVKEAVSQAIASWMEKQSRK